MDDVQRCHEVLLQQRTQIRHHQGVHLWMKRCWQAAVHADPHALTQDEYEDMYSILMYEMTICWEEELNDAILLKIWKRDAASHATLNFERFCCSIFYFVEMWVEEITLAEYEKIFCHVYRILSGHDLHRTVQPPPAGSPSRGASPDYKPRTFKPTLESFNNALDNQKAMEELQMNFGKSISFNAQQYYRHFGTPTTHLQAFQATLLHLQSRVHIERGESGAATTSRERETTKPAMRPTTSTTAESTARMLRRQLKEARKKPAVNTRGTGALDTRPPSPLRSDAASLSLRQPPSSPPKLMRPVSSACRSSFVLDCDAGVIGGNASATSPERHRPSGDAFVMTGKSVLHSPLPHAR